MYGPVYSTFRSDGDLKCPARLRSSVTSATPRSATFTSASSPLFCVFGSLNTASCPFGMWQTRHRS